MGEYEWSSYNIIIGNRKEKIIDASLILNYFKYNNRVKLYLNFVESDLEFDLSLRNPR
jgi:putative transposase